VALTVAQLPGYLRKIADELRERAPIEAARAMGNAYIPVVVNSMRGPAPSPPGTPPARRSGTLARSIRRGPGHSTGPYSYTVFVAPHTVYARIQQLGGHIRPKHTTAGGRLGYLRWEDKGGVHYSQHVYLPKRPYMVMSEQARTACHDAAAAAAASLFKAAE
jgi:phage gpG-like protein